MEKIMDYQLNKVKLDLASYRHYWRGTPGSGKTSTFRDLIIEEYSDPYYGLLISLGQEIGYKALDNLVVKDCPDWGSFTDVVEDLVENKEENKFKLLCLDTVDELVEMAERKVLQIHRQQKGESAVSINASLGGYGAGKKKARSLIEEQIAKLERAGYGMVYISHSKLRDVNEKSTDQTYQMLTGALEFAYDAIFADRADIMAMFTVESNVVKERVTDSQRWMYFRSNNFIDAKSRFAYVPERAELSAKNYIKVLKEALEKSGGVSGKEAEKIRKEEVSERQEKAETFIKEVKTEKYPNLTLEQYQNEVLDYAKTLSPEIREVKKAELKRKGLSTNFKEIDDMETLKKVRAILAAED